MARETITITEYAKSAGITRDAVYKQITNGNLPKGIRIIKVAGRQFVSIPKES